MNRQLINRAYTFEIELSTQRNKFSFPEILLLRGKKIVYIDFFRVSDVSFAPSGRATVNNTIFAKTFLTLVTAGIERFNKIPLNNFVSGLQYGNRILLNEVIDWEKSFLNISELSGFSTSESFVFTVYYHSENKLLEDNFNSKISTYENVEIIVPSTTTKKIMLPENLVLANKKIFNIRAYSLTNLGVSPSNYTAVASAIFIKSYLTLVKNNYEVLTKIPLYALFNYNTAVDILNFDNLEFDLTQSYIDISEVTGLTANTVFMIGFNYDKSKPVLKSKIPSRRNPA